MPLRNITVKACKYDGHIHRSWKCEITAETADYWVLNGVFADEIRHPLLGVIRPGTVSVEFYWKKLCYNIFRFHEPDGALRNFYCNVNLPPVLSGDELIYIDLDVDVLVAPDLSYQILDLDEFAENTEKYKYPPEIVRAARASLAELIRLIENEQFPFDFKSEV